MLQIVPIVLELLIRVVRGHRQLVGVVADHVREHILKHMETKRGLKYPVGPILILRPHNFAIWDRSLSFAGYVLPELPTCDTIDDC